MYEYVQEGVTKKSVILVKLTNAKIDHTDPIQTIIGL